MILIPPTRNDEAVIRSFRDPAGALLRYPDRILRTVQPENAPELAAFLATQTAHRAMEEGKLVRSVRLSEGEATELDLGTSTVYEHERIPFPSYPHEWPAEMLAEAAALSIELFQQALTEGFGLKDATPYNLLFRGSEPVFVDALSFERRGALDATWMAYGQFVRTFLLPLLAARHFGLSPDAVFLSKRDGLEPDTLFQWAGFWKRLRPSFLSLVTLPHYLSGRATAQTYHPRPAASAEQARFILDRVLAGCAKQVRTAVPAARNESGNTSRESTWSGYLDHKSLYSPAQLAAKEIFVKEALDLTRASQVLDVGANEGHFSFLAARHGASVVSIDTDPAVVGTLWRKAKQQRLDVLPLVVDLTRPTPALGWRNQETASFLERAHQRFDLVLMLAVIHHMMVSERIPLEQLMGLTAELTRDYALIEFVAPRDPMFARIVRGREALYSHLTVEAFEAAAAPHFELVKFHKLDGLDRCFYLYRRRREHI